MVVRVGKLKVNVDKQVREATAKAAQKCADLIAANAPVGVSGEYRDFWRWEFADNETAVIYNNGPHRSLSHLLEKGHIVYDGDGGIAWSPAQPHIRPAFEQVKKEYLEDLKNIKITNQTSGGGH